MTSVPSPSSLPPPATYLELFLKEQLDTMCEFEDELYNPESWNDRFPSFIFESLIAETDNSLVWTGRDKNRCETVALKITEIFESETSEKIHQMKQNAFLGQYRLAHMAEVREIINTNEFRLIVMKQYPWNLTHLLRRFTNTTKKYTQEHLNFIIYALRAIIIALEEIHNIGYVHRDLKPDNFLVDSQFNFVVTDFALITKELEIDVSSSGTLEYLAPERLSKKRRQSPVKKAIDIWALGIILYELFTGENPFNGECEEEILDSICQGYIRNKEIPASAMSLINGILEVNSDKRFTLENIKNHPFLQTEVNKNLLLDTISTCF